jgi:calcineurin-like phosphoesterase family protein
MKMPNMFVISDTHFSHKGIVQFLRPDGTKERPWDNIEEMDEALVKNWNSVVGPKDKVVHLGDVVINRSALKILSRLNGIKSLVKGNHDGFRLEEYAEYFKNIHGNNTYDDFLLTHIPVHPLNIGRWKGNIHGHLHSERVIKEQGYFSKGSDVDGSSDWWFPDVVDPRYLCVSVEQIDYTPLAWEDCKKRFEEQQSDYYY